MRRIIVLVVAVIMLSTWSSMCWAGEAATTQLKLNDAIDMALQNNKSLRLADLDVDKNQEKYNLSSKILGFLPDAGVGNSPLLDSSFYSLLSTSMNWEMSKKTFAAEEDKLVLGICEKYWNVQKNIEDVKYKEIAVDKAQLALKRVNAMIQVGMLPGEYSAGTSPQMAMADAKGKLLTAKSDLEAAKNALTKSYEELNMQIGLSKSERPDLVDEPQYEPMKEINLDTEVSRVLANSPTVWKAAEQARLAEITDAGLNATGQYTQYEVRKIEQQQAVITANSTRDAVDLATRNIYYSVRNLEAGIPAAERAVEQAVEAVRVAKISYQLGMITKENFKQSEMAMELANKTLMELKINHAYWKMAFQKPWAVNTATATASQ